MEWTKETTDNAFYPSFVGIFNNQPLIRLYKAVYSKDVWLVSSWSLGFSHISLLSVELEDAKKEAINVTIRQLEKQSEKLTSLTKSLRLEIQ